MSIRKAQRKTRTRSTLCRHLATLKHMKLDTIDLRILADNAGRADAVADATLAQVYDRVGLLRRV